MITHQTNVLETPQPIAQELSFLSQHTGQTEMNILTEALRIGLSLLYQKTVEKLFIDEKMPYKQALAIIGSKRMAELEYAKKALQQDIMQGLSL